MATISEDYVSFETAKLLKEKGFDEPTLYYYIAGHLLQHYSLLSNGDTAGTSAPTLQMAMKWLREKYNLFIEIQCYGCGADEEAHFEFSFVVSEFMQFDNKICTTVGLKEKKAKSQHNTYEEACEAAIKYCLDNLI